MKLIKNNKLFSQKYNDNHERHEETIIIINEQLRYLLFIKNFITSNFEYIPRTLKKEMSNNR